jgi:Domain of unknown function (DUF6378)
VSGDGHIQVTQPYTGPKDRTVREEVLQTAESLVMGDRNRDYSSPQENFDQTAGLWSEYLRVPLKAHDVAVLMILAKVSRLSTSPGKLDNWIDIAGYAACGAEVSPTPAGS